MKNGCLTVAIPSGSTSVDFEGIEGCEGIERLIGRLSGSLTISSTITNSKHNNLITLSS